jgi:hypothetical protein
VATIYFETYLFKNWWHIVSNNARMSALNESLIRFKTRDRSGVHVCYHFQYETVCIWRKVQDTKL